MQITIDSKLTAGGAYVTAGDENVFQGLLRLRLFVQSGGEGETATARQRAIAGHAAELLKNVCLHKDPHSPYADREGYVPFGKLVDYAGGRSDGCVS